MNTQFLLENLQEDIQIGYMPQQDVAARKKKATCFGWNY